MCIDHSPSDTSVQFKVHIAQKWANLRVKPGSYPARTTHPYTCTKSIQVNIWLKEDPNMHV